MSGNPSGKPRAKDTEKIATYIRDQTNGGIEIIDQWLAIIRGGYPEDTKEKARHSLMNRFVGTAPARIDIDIDDGSKRLDVRQLDEDRLRLLEHVILEGQTESRDDVIDADVVDESETEESQV